MLFDEIQKGETDSLEFKRDMPDDHLKFLKTAVAFANCNGGRIVFGVDDDRSIVGVDPLGAFRLADRVVDTISNSCAPQMAVSTEVATVARKNVVVVSVPMGMSTPYFIKSLGKADEKNDAVTENVTRNVTRNVARKTKLQKDILDSVAGKLGITQEELAQRFGVARMTIMRNMARLVSEGLLRHVGPDKGGHWKVVTPHEAENHHD